MAQPSPDEVSSVLSPGRVEQPSSEKTLSPVPAPSPANPGVSRKGQTLDPLQPELPPYIEEPLKQIGQTQDPSTFNPLLPPIPPEQQQQDPETLASVVKHNVLDPRLIPSTIGPVVTIPSGGQSVTFPLVQRRYIGSPRFDSIDGMRVVANRMHAGNMIVYHASGLDGSQFYSFIPTNSPLSAQQATLLPSFSFQGLQWSFLSQVRP